MSTPNHDSDKPRYVTSGHAITIVYDGKGQVFPKGDPRGRPAEPKFELAYDRSHHIIRITEPGGKTAEFDDRPTRFLVMTRNPGTRAPEPVIFGGEPLYYYLAREK